MGEPYRPFESPHPSTFPSAPPAVETSAPYPSHLPYSPGAALPGGYLSPARDQYEGGSGQTSGLAIASLVCSLVGLFIGLASIAGVICGHLALREINQSNGRVGGRGLAIAGLVISYISIVLYVALIVLLMFIFIALASAPNFH